MRLLGFFCASGAGQEAEAVLPFNRRGRRPARSCDLIRAEVAAGGLLLGADASDGPSRGEAAARRAVRDAVSVRSRAEAASSLRRIAALRPGAAAGCRSLAGSSCFATGSAQTCSRVEACGAPVSTDAGLRAREAAARPTCVRFDIRPAALCEAEPFEGDKKQQRKESLSAAIFRTPCFEKIRPA